MKSILFSLMLLIVANTASAVDKKAAPKAVSKGKNMTAVFETSQGTFKIKLFATEAPGTVENFVGLVEGTKEWTDPKSGKKEKKPLYNNTVFHRVIKDFMIQGGDPLGTGFGGPGFTIKDEFHPELRHNKPGILSMANTGRPNTGGSQFFILTGPAPHLDDKHAVFGEVVEGMDVVRKIENGKVSGDKPVEPVKLISVKIERK